MMKTTKHGFAALSEARRREIARLGGKAVHQQGKAHCFTSEQAKAAGRKGGILKKKNIKRVLESIHIGEVVDPLWIEALVKDGLIVRAEKAKKYSLTELGLRQL